MKAVVDTNVLALTNVRVIGALEVPKLWLCGQTIEAFSPQHLWTLAQVPSLLWPRSLSFLWTLQHFYFLH